MIEIKEILQKVQCVECGQIEFKRLNNYEFVCLNCGAIYSLDELFDMYERQFNEKYERKKKNDYY